MVIACFTCRMSIKSMALITAKQAGLAHLPPWWWLWQASCTCGMPARHAVRRIANALQCILSVTHALIDSLTRSLSLIHSHIGLRDISSKLSACVLSWYASVVHLRTGSDIPHAYMSWTLVKYKLAVHSVSDCARCEIILAL